jgi:hypothetical protein
MLRPGWKNLGMTGDGSLKPVGQKTLIQWVKKWDRPYYGQSLGCKFGKSIFLFGSIGKSISLPVILLRLLI